MFQTCRNNWGQALRTHPDIGLTTTSLQFCLQICNKKSICKNAQLVLYTKPAAECTNAVSTMFLIRMFSHILFPAFWQVVNGCLMLLDELFLNYKRPTTFGHGTINSTLKWQCGLMRPALLFYSVYAPDDFTRIGEPGTGAKSIG